MGSGEWAGEMRTFFTTQDRSGGGGGGLLGVRLSTKNDLSSWEAFFY